MKFGRKGSKTVLITIIAFICLHTQHGRYGFARSEYSYLQSHSGKLQNITSALPLAACLRWNK